MLSKAGKRKRNLFRMARWAKLNKIAYRNAGKLLKKPTKAELVFKEALDKAGILYIFQQPITTKTNAYIVDFWINRKSSPIAIEINGGYHNTIRQQRKDAKRGVEIIMATRCELKIYTNEEVFNNTDAIISELTAILPERCFKSKGTEEPKDKCCTR